MTHTPTQNHDEILARLDKMEEAQSKRFKAIEDKLEPISQAWTSVSGFNKIAVWLFKILLGLGALITTGYIFVELLRKLAR